MMCVVCTVVSSMLINIYKLKVERKNIRDNNVKTFRILNFLIDIQNKFKLLLNLFKYFIRYKNKPNFEICTHQKKQTNINISFYHR